MVGFNVPCRDRREVRVVLFARVPDLQLQRLEHPDDHVVDPLHHALRGPDRATRLDPECLDRRGVGETDLRLRDGRGYRDLPAGDYLLGLGLTVSVDIDGFSLQVVESGERRGRDSTVREPCVDKEGILRPRSRREIKVRFSPLPKARSSWERFFSFRSRCKTFPNAFSSVTAYPPARIKLERTRGTV